MIDVLHVPAFEDNYIWLIHRDGRAVIVDPGDEDPVLAALAEHALTPAAIVCTHHHWDHTGGVTALQARYDLPVYGPAAEAIPAMTHALEDGARVTLAALGLELAVLAVPGHTRGHIAYYGGDMLFCGDTLFSAGCGRLFEGTPTQMHDSLGRLADLPPATRVYCGHEYTQSNLRFAAAVEPHSPAIAAYRREVSAQRARGQPSLPSTLARERAVNPFLRTGEDGVRRAAARYAGHALDDDVAVFAALRRWKDGFRG